MELKELKQHWDIFGEKDPLWAVLTKADKKDGGWDEADFFLRGEKEIDRVLGVVRGLHGTVRYGMALDFGCGVGRLTQALCSHFRECHGVDIATSMVEKARTYNRHGERCQYHVNDRDDLRLFDDATFDFIYTNIVLQHMRPEYSHRYIREFLRIVKPGGLVVFQIPGKPMDASQLQYRAWIIPAQTTMTMHPGMKMKLQVKVKNVSDFTWPEVNLGNHWLNDFGEEFIHDDARTPLPEGMEPGHEATIVLTVTAPLQVGQYQIELDGVQEGKTWFASRGSKPARIYCSVVPVPPPPPMTLYHKLAKTYRQLLARTQRPMDETLAVTETPPSPQEPAGKNQPEVIQARMEMYGTPREHMLSLLAEWGASVLHVEKDHAAGCDWESWRYYVTR